MSGNDGGFVCDSTQLPNDLLTSLYVNSLVLKQGLVYWVVPYQVMMAGLCIIQHYQMVKVVVVPVEAPGSSVSGNDGGFVYDSTQLPNDFVTSLYVNSLVL